MLAIDFHHRGGVTSCYPVDVIFFIAGELVFLSLLLLLLLLPPVAQGVCSDLEDVVARRGARGLEEVGLQVDGAHVSEPVVDVSGSVGGVDTAVPCARIQAQLRGSDEAEQVAHQLGDAAVQQHLVVVLAMAGRRHHHQADGISGIWGFWPGTATIGVSLSKSSGSLANVLMSNRASAMCFSVAMIVFTSNGSIVDKVVRCR